MTVFVLHPVAHDLSAAKVFGELRFLTRGHIFADEIDHARPPPETRDALWQAANQFKPSSDYFLLIGDQLQIALFTAMLVSLNESKFNVLRYDQKEKAYFAVEIRV